MSSSVDERTSIVGSSNRKGRRYGAEVDPYSKPPIEEVLPGLLARSRFRHQKLVAYHQEQAAKRGRVAENIVNLPDDLLDEVLATLKLLEQAEEASADRRLNVGESPTREELLTATFERLQTRLRWRGLALAQRVPADELASHGWTEERIVAERRSLRLVAIEHRGEYLVPRWQFDTHFEVLPGLADVLHDFPAGMAAFNTWMSTRNPWLDDLYPRDVLVEDKARVLAAIQTMRARSAV
jgi:hypothetical protein